MTLSWRRISIAGLLLCLSVVYYPTLLGATDVVLDPPPDIASYDIRASYDPATYTITGVETVTYVNRTTAPIPDLVWHLYLNAFQSADTQWMREAGPGHRGYSYDETTPAAMHITRMTLADSRTLEWEALDTDATLVRAALPQAIPGGDAVQVTLEFTASLPHVFARTGWADEGNFVMAGQWFPKLGVWQAGKWNAYPFHANSEFYSDFGAYTVTLTLPADWKVGATGEVQGTPQLNADATRAHTYHARHVIDFAWSASPEFETLHAEQDGVAVDVLHYPTARAAALRAQRATLGGLRFYGETYGSYGRGLYPHLTVIMVPPDGGGAGGMEYPTLFTVGALASGPTFDCIRILEVETVHELGHQWFQSVVATNEAEDPWLDEGITDYLTIKAMNALYEGAVSTCLNWRYSYAAMRRIEYQSAPGVSIAGAAWDFDTGAYGIATYSKPAIALSTLENSVGSEAMRHFMRTYYERYAFKHPTTEDVRNLMAETLGEEIASHFFEQVIYGDATYDVQVTALTANGFTLERQGDICFPVEVRVLTHKTETFTWGCDEMRRTFDIPGVQQVELDPTYGGILDISLANNGLRRDPDWHVIIGMGVRTLRLLQDFMWGGAIW